MNIQDWFPLGWTGWIPCNPRDSQGSSPTSQFKSINSLVLSFLYSPLQSFHIHTWLLEKQSLTRWTFVGKVMSWLLNTLSWSQLSFQASFNFMATVIIHSDFGAPQNKVSHSFHCFPIYLPWSDGTRYHDLSFLNVEFYFILFYFWMLSFKTTLSLSSFVSSRGLLVPLHFLP